MSFDASIIIVQMIKLSTELILEDLDDSISLDHHSQLWSALRWSIDRAKGSTKDKISTTVINLS